MSKKLKNGRTAQEQAERCASFQRSKKSSYSPSEQKKRCDDYIRSQGGGKSHSSSKKGGCYLTTACVEYMGLPDNCHQLEALRQFRDSYIASSPDGITAIEEYYRVAPFIVEEINSNPSRTQILSSIFASVNSIVDLIDRGKNREARASYEYMYLHIQEKLLNTNTFS